LASAPPACSRNSASANGSTSCPRSSPAAGKQHVAIARALANEPDLVLADEPTANLDSSIGREVMRRSQSVLIVSHDDRIREFVDRVLWLEDGEFKNERALVRDPICGMEVDPDRAPAHATVDGTDYSFCAQGCRDEFLAARGSEPAPSRHASRMTPTVR
jgi:putative ABC transport system ATP-binding protein